MLSVQNIAAMVDANREEALAFFQQCVRTPSVTGSEAAMGEVVRQFLARQGFAPQVYEKANELLQSWLRRGVLEKEAERLAAARQNGPD